MSLTGKPLDMSGLRFFPQTLLYSLFCYDNDITIETLKMRSTFQIEVRILATTVRVFVFQTRIYLIANVKK